MSRKVLLFAPCAFNLAETSRMVEIAKGVRHHAIASQVFDVHFISDGGEFEQLIERHGFPLTRLDPRLTPEKLEHIAKVDRGEKFAPAFTDREMIERVRWDCLFNADHSARQRRVHWLWWPTLGHVFAEEHANIFVYEPVVIVGSHDQACVEAQRRIGERLYDYTISMKVCRGRLGKDLPSLAAG